MKRVVVILALACIGAGGAEEPVGSAAEPDAPRPTSARQIEELRAEIVALRSQVDKLQTTLDVYVNGMVAELQDENTRLRRLLRRTYGQEPEALPAVPTPDQDLLEDAISNPEPAALAPAEEPASAPPPREFTATVVREWGRTVDEAKQLGEGVQSLKGMIVAVPAGSTDEQLRHYAHSLRRDLDAYENINVEVFETEESATAFAEGNAAAGQDRVLSISKHAGSGRDVAVLIRGDHTEEIPLKNADTANQ